MILFSFEEERPQSDTTQKRGLLISTRSAMNRSQITFSELTLEKDLGEGSYGKVCLGKWNETPVALKFCKSKGKTEDFMREMKLMMYVTDIPISVTFEK
jgi:serine/threonine protein kinase